MSTITNRFSLRDHYIVFLLFGVFLIGVILSMLRFPVDDEAYYLRETSLIYECIKNFQWFGNELVGVHGFLFKLPAALLFFLTGPSIFTATLTNILLGIFIIFLSYIISLEIMGSREWAVAVSYLVASSVYFVRVLPTFLRDFPVLFSLLFLLYLVIKKKNIWIIGLSLLLILDAKEGVFFAILPGFMIWIIHQVYLKNKRLFSIKSISTIVSQGLIVLLPAVLYIILMTTTSLIPINVKLTSTLGLNKGGITEAIDYQVKNVEGQYKVWILDEKTPNPEKRTSIKNTCSNKLKALIHLFILYFRKILYYRTFSLSSLPRFVILPAFLMSFVLFKRWRKSEDSAKLVTCYIFWSYLLVYIFRSSHGRYLLPIIPLAYLFFVFFLRDGIEMRKFFRNVLIAIFSFMLLGFLFERQYVPIKACLSIIVMGGFFLMYYLQKRNKAFLFPVRWSILLVIGIFSFSIQIAASILLPGQIGRFMAWGQNGEFKEIARILDKKGPVWINTDFQLLKFYHKDDLSISFKNGQDRWELKDNIPKSAHLNRDRTKYVFCFEYETNEQFRQSLEAHEIQYVMMVVSTYTMRDMSFPKEQYLPIMNTLPYLKLIQTIKMKNKMMYIYEKNGH